MLAHVVADELVAEVNRELLGELGLADSRWSVNRKHPAGRSGWTQPGARSLDRVRDRAHRFLLTKHHAAERFERPKPLAIRGAGLLGRESGHSRDDLLHVGDCYGPRSSCLGPRAVPRALFPEVPRSSDVTGSSGAVRRRSIAPASSSTSIAESGSR